MPLYSVISQRDYPGVDPVPRDGSPDIDDCQFLAAIWCATGADPIADRPDLSDLRRAAGVPDRAGVQGANIDDVAKAIGDIWPTVPFQKFRTTNWSAIDIRLDKGDYVSISVLSRVLPPRHRYGFLGAHQVAVVRRRGKLYLANPLAPDGSQPEPIAEDALRAAARALAGGTYLAIAFQQVQRWQVRVVPGFWGRFRFTRSGLLERKRVSTARGFSARCGPAARHTFNGRELELVPILSGDRKGYWANRRALNVRVKSLNL